MAEDINNVLPEQEGSVFKAGDIAGTGKLAGLIAVFQELGTSVESLLRSPAAAGTLTYKLGREYQRHWLDKLKEGKKLSEENTIALDRFIGKRSYFMWFAAGISGVIGRMVQLNAELRKGATEVGRYTNLSQLPGGAQSPMQAMVKLRQMQLNKAWDFNEEFGKQFNQVYQNIYRRLNRVGKREGLSSEQTETVRQDMATRMARNQMFYGLPAEGTLEGFRDVLRGSGIGDQFIQQILDQLVLGMESAKLDFSLPEAAELTRTLAKRFRSEAGFTGEQAIVNALSTIETLNQEKLDLGAEDILKVTQGISDFYTSVSKNAAVKQILGISDTAMQGPSGAMNVLSAQQRWVKSTIPGTGRIQNLAELDTATRARIENLGALVGLSPDMVVLLNNLDDIGSSLTTMSDQWYENFQAKKMFTDSADLERQNKIIDDSINKSRTLYEIFSNLISRGVTSVNKALGTEESPQWVQDLVGLGAGSLLALGGGMLLKRKAGKFLETILRGGLKGGLPSGVGGGVVTEGALKGASSAFSAGTILDKYGKPFTSSAAELTGAGARSAAELAEVGAMGAAKGGGWLGKLAGKLPLSKLGGMAGKSSKLLGPIGWGITGIDAYSDIKGRLGKGESWHEAGLRWLGDQLDFGMSISSLPVRLPLAAIQGKNLTDTSLDFHGFFGGTKSLLDMAYGTEAGDLTATDLKPMNTYKSITSTGDKSRVASGEAVVRIIITNDNGQVLGEGDVNPYSDAGVQKLFRIQAAGIVGGAG